MSLADDLVALSPTALLGADGAGRIVFANAAAGALLGVPASELPGRPLAAFGIRIPAGDSEWHATIDLEVETGSPVPCRVEGRRLDVTRGGGSALALVDLRPSQERAGLAADLEAVRPLERVARLAGGIAHDLKNVFQVLLGHGELIARKLPEDPKIKSSLDHMLQAAERGNRSADAIMSLGRGAGSRSACSLGAVVGASVPGLRATLPAGVALHVVISDPAPTVMGNDLALRRIVEELTANAIEAMPRGGVLTIAAEPRPEGGALLQVTDTGGGMSADTLERIRRPHALAGLDSRQRGLGLAVVGRIAREHGGSLDVSSEPGKGTIARVLFPKVPTPA